MLQVEPSTLFPFELSHVTGVANDLELRIEDINDVLVSGPETGAVEFGIGQYRIQLETPSTEGFYVAIWSDGSQEATEQFEVTTSFPSSTAIGGIGGGAGGPNLGELLALLDGYGLDLTEAETVALFNEGYTKLATESGWTRATIPLTAVTDQEFYELPPAVYDIRQVFVDGDYYGYQDEKTVRRIQDQALYLRGNGIFWQQFNSDGDEGIGLYPTVDTGTDIEVICVARPTPLEDMTDIPRIPQEHRRGIVDYAAAMAYNIEDNAELRAFHQSEFDRHVAELRALRVSRVKPGPTQVRVAGVHV